MFFGHPVARQTLQKMNFDFKRPMRTNRVSYVQYVHVTACLLTDLNLNKLCVPGVVNRER
jgi:hypothetical protein